jgi:hypothetical protein
MPAYVTAKIRDHGTEYTTAAFPIASAVAGTTWADLLSYMTTLETALGGISLGTIVEISFRQLGVENADAPAANAFAQRELGLRFFLIDDTNGDKSYITVGCPDLANIDLETDGDHADMTDTEVAAMITWIEANVEINDGNSVTVDRVIVVGRSS